MTFEALSRHPVFIDQFALGAEGDIRHISLADAAELLLVAPATANVLGKFAHGIADDALTTLYLATKAPVVVAPAMNVNMFDHPAVRENLETCARVACASSSPGPGYLACGWLGTGRLAEVAPSIVAAAAIGACSAPARARPRRARRCSVTRDPRSRTSIPCASSRTARAAHGLPPGRGRARPRRARDPRVRARRRSPAPAASTLVRVRSAEEMARAVAERAASGHVVAMAAAVSDYRPAQRSPNKMKKADGAARARAGAHDRHPGRARPSQGPRCS